MNNRKHLNLIPSEDGTTHINVRIPKGKIDHDNLGHKLAIDYPRKFIHPSLGLFHSIEAFWRYLSTNGREDDIRQLSYNRPLSYELRKYINQNTVKVSDFYDLINDGVLTSVLSDSQLVEFIKNDINELPFVCYDVFEGVDGNLATETTSLRFYVSGLVYARNVIKGRIKAKKKSYLEFLKETNKLI